MFVFRVVMFNALGNLSLKEVLCFLPTVNRDIMLLGGEPTLRDTSFLKELINELYRRTKKVAVLTNGTKPDKLKELTKTFPEMHIDVSMKIHDDEEIGYRER